MSSKTAVRRQPDGRQGVAEKTGRATDLGKRDCNRVGWIDRRVDDKLDVAACSRGRTDRRHGRARRSAYRRSRRSTTAGRESRARHAGDKRRPRAANVCEPAAHLHAGPDALPAAAEKGRAFHVNSRRIGPLVRELLALSRRGRDTVGTEHADQDGARSPQLAGIECRRGPPGRLPIRLPNEFYFECRYSAYMPEVTRGVLGWWKEPVGTRISLIDQQGGKYMIEWVMKCGNDLLRPNPLGSSTLYAKKCFHTVKLSDGTTNEIEAMQPTGMLRIERDKNAIEVFVDGQAVIAGTISPAGQLVGFEIDVVKARNGTLFFTDFKVGR